jgi:LuxR family quorum-sensing system transcriptional regulator SolR
MSLLSNDYIELINKVDVKSICAPLFRNTPISCFDYSRYYTDHSFFGMSSMIDFDIVYINLGIQPTFYEIDYYNQPFGYLSSSAPPALNSAKIITNIQLASDFGIDNRFYILTKFADYYEACGFSISNSVNGYTPTIFLTQMDMLKQFIRYFKEKAHDYLIALSMNRISQPKTETLISLENDVAKAFNPISFAEDIKLSSYSILVDGIPIKLTYREIECLRLLKNNVTSKIIANRLGISHRTVDTHVNNIKTKLDCHFESELIKIAQENNL